MKLKKVMLLTTAFILAASMTACSQAQDAQSGQSEEIQTENSAQEGPEEIQEENLEDAVEGSMVMENAPEYSI